MFKISEIPITDEKYEDPNKKFKDEITDLVNKYYLYDNEFQLRLISNVYKHCAPILEAYGLKLIFKGGNVMNLINNNFMRYLNVSTKDTINQFIKEFLQKSDNDFTILINPFIEDYENVINIITLELFNALNDNRNEIENNPSYFFYFYNLNTRAQHQILSLKMAEINEKYGINITKLNPWKIEDFIYDFSPIRHSIDVYASKSKHYIFNSMNKTIEFNDVRGEIIKFYLLRSKVNYMMNNMAQYAGELIDISIPYRSDAEMKKFKSSDEFEAYMNKYIDEYYNPNYNFKYHIINIHYIIGDLYRILFVNNAYPWDDKKYNKRLARLIYFIFLGLLEEKTISKETINMVIKIFKDFYTSLISLSERGISSSNLNDWLDKILNITAGYYATLQYDKKIIDDPDMIQFNLYISNLNKYVEFILTVCNNIHKALSGLEVVEDESLYNINVN